MKQMDNEKVLNKEQLEAIQHGSGPLLIIAGAGTGKTTVITERIKWLISKDLAKPSEILALTFTDKAAREMEERVDVAMPYGYTQMWIMTFHSFGERILRNEALHIGLNPRYKLMADADAFIFVKKNFWKFDISYFRPSGNPYKFIEGMIQHFSRLKDEDISPAEYYRWAQAESEKLKAKNQNLKLKTNKDEEEVESEKWLELARAYKTYEELKIKEGVMDFGDLITNTLKLFRTRKNVLKQYQEQFKYILIDEFQDTNIAQNELAILLAGEKGNLTVVADDDQSIYRFRGAAVSNILQFKDRFPKAKIVTLTKNYRSTEEILEKAYRLIQFNNPDRLEVKERINKKLFSMRRIKGEEIKFIHTDRIENETEEVVMKIKRLTSRGIVDSSPHQNERRMNSATPYDFKDIAILVRANSHAEAFTRALSRHGIPYQFLGPGILFKQPEVKDLIAYLKVLNDFFDSVSLYRVLTMDIWGISARDLVAITSYAKRYNLSLFEVMEEINKYQIPNTKNQKEREQEPNTRDINNGNVSNSVKFLLNISAETKEKIRRIVEMIYRHLKLVPKETAGQILFYFLKDSGLLEKLTDYKTVKDERKTANISKFFDKLRQFEIDHEDASVSAVCDWLDLNLEIGESPLAADIDWSDNNAVNLLTVHSSKGLEFPVVFLVNLVNQRFPTTERREQIPIPNPLIKEILPVGDYHLEEERRLFYVGLTRARDLLYLTASDYYGEGKRERKISPFVMETLGEEVIRQLLNKQSREEKSSQLSIFDWKKTPEDKERKEQREKQGGYLINYLSYSQIETFKTCPLQFKYRYFLKIPIPSSSAQSFGSSLHSALRDFYRGLLSGQKLNENDLLKLLEDNWLSEGYASKKHEETAKEKGRKYLKDYFNLIRNQKILTIKVEEPFSFRVRPDLKIIGRIDRVDKLPDGTLELWDYKTGIKTPTQKDIDKNFQLTVYALAACDQGIFAKKPEDLILSLYFFETGQKFSTKRTQDQLKEAREEILKIAKEISESDFSPKSNNMCEFCEYRMLCDAWR